MRSLKVKLVINIIILLLLSSINSGNTSLVLNQSGQIGITPTTFASLLYEDDTFNFIENSRFISDNQGSAVEDIYYRLGVVKLLDPQLNNLSSNLKTAWTTKVLSFQNPDGGFGSWEGDKSSVTSTKNALQVLSWLNTLNQINTTHTQVYLDSLHNTLTGGYESDNYDTDSDVYSTHLAVIAYNLLGLSPIGPSNVSDLFIRAQNDGTALPSTELGGFGKQTNNIRGIYWTSEISVTSAAITGLDILGSIASIDQSAASSFINGLKQGSGGYLNDHVTIASSSITYTSSAIEGLSILGAIPSDTSSQEGFIYGLEEIDGGFRLKSTSTKSSLIATYFAVNALDLLGLEPTDVQNTIDYVLDFSSFTDGYGSSPSASPTLRETYDAVESYVIAGREVPNKQGILSYVNSYYNPDGGYGILGSYTESTFRAVSIYSLLGTELPNKATTIQFLQSLQQDSDGGFVKSSTDSVSYVISTYRAVNALNLLGSQPLSVTNVISYLKQNQRSDGGFAGYFTDPGTSDVSSTYRAVRALAILGDTPNNPVSAISFLKNSQNSNGGFKRGINDIVAPANQSSMIYTYSAVRALSILNEHPNNASSLYDYIASVRNTDGGYGIQPLHTSDIAYTFVSLYLLRNMHEISEFYVEPLSPTNNTETNEITFSLAINGGIKPFTIEVYLDDVLQTPVVTDTGSQTNVDIIIPGDLSVENNMTITITDRTGAAIHLSPELFGLIITFNQMLLIAIVGGSVIVVIIIFFLIKKK